MRYFDFQLLPLVLASCLLTNTIKVEAFEPKTGVQVYRDAGTQVLAVHSLAFSSKAKRISSKLLKGGLELWHEQPDGWPAWVPSPVQIAALLLVIAFHPPTVYLFAVLVPGTFPTRFRDLSDLRIFSLDKRNILVGEWQGHTWFIKIDGEGDLGVREAAILEELEKIPDVSRHLPSGTNAGFLSEDDLLVLSKTSMSSQAFPLEWLLGKPFLLMKKIEGQSLEFYFKHTKMLNPENFFFEVAISISQALHELHENGVVHQDLGPEEIFLEATENKGWSIRFADFGLSTTPKHPLSTLPSDYHHRVKQEYGNGEREGPDRDLYALKQIIYHIGSHLEIWHAANLRPFLSSFVSRWHDIASVEIFIHFLEEFMGAEPKNAFSPAPPDNVLTQAA